MIDMIINLLLSLLAIVAVALAFGALLGWTAVKFKLDGDPMVDKIEEILPQTQCGQCGHPGCRPYAEAIAKGEEINKCPPGGEAGIKALADLLGREPLPLNEELEEKETQTVVYIREPDCIGCTKCIQACPVDAIVGSAKMMHTVITEDCTGCDLCIPPCPVDCIEIHPVEEPASDWHVPKPSDWIPVKQL